MKYSAWTLEILEAALKTAVSNATLSALPPLKENKRLDFLVRNQTQRSARRTTPSPPEFNILSALKI